MARPIAIMSRIAAHHGTPCFMARAPTPPMNATTEPTDRSMWVAMMTISMPMAATSTYAFCWNRATTLFGFSRRPPVRIWKTTITSTRAR